MHHGEGLALRLRNGLADAHLWPGCHELDPRIGEPVEFGLHHPRVVLGDVGEPFYCCLACGGLDKARHLAEDEVERGFQHVVAAAKVDVERTLGNARGRRDPRDGGAGNPELRNHFEHGRDDLRPSLVGR